MKILPQGTITKAQDDWLIKEAKRLGVSKTNVIRFWLNEQIAKDSGK